MSKTDNQLVVRLKGDRIVKVAELVQLNSGAERAHRSLTRTEADKVLVLEREIQKLDDEIEAERSPRQPGKFDPRRAQGGSVRDVDGEGSADLLAPEQRVSDWARERGHMTLSSGLEGLGDPDRFSLGKMVRGACTGIWESAELEQRALAEGVLAQGGYLIPTPLAAQMIDRVRNAMQVMAAGATTVPMTAATLKLARLAGGATVAWKSENQPITPSAPTFEGLTLTAQTLPIIITLPAELFEDLSPEATDLIEHEVAVALSLELDRACLRGSGSTPEPKGIRNQSGVTLQSLGANGANVNYDNVIDAVSNVRNLNIEPNSMIMASRTKQVLSKLKSSTGEYLPVPPGIDTVTQLVSNQVPVNLTQGSSNVASEIYTGRWSDLLVGIRTDMRMQVRVLTERYIDNLQYGLLCYLRADVALAHPESFNVTTGVL